MISNMNVKKAVSESKYRTVLTSEQTKINSLIAFGHAWENKAELPTIGHSHRDKLEFMILISGIQDFKASDVTYTLYDCDSIAAFPGEVHSIGKSPCQSNEIIWFQLDISTDENFLSLGSEEAKAVYKRLEGFKARQLHLPRRLINMFMESFDLLKRDNALEKIKGHSLFVYALISMLDQKGEVKALTSDVNKAKQYILLHIKEAIDTDELLIASGLSAPALKEKFRDQIGMSVREFIKREKIEKCKHEVARTNTGIADIAFEYSFSSTKYFNMLFKKATGCSPKKFRRRYKNGKIELD